MNTEETSYWAGTFLPGTITEQESSGLTLLVTEDAVMTNGLAETPTGLVVDGAPLELRCELLVVGNPGSQVLADAVAAVADLVAQQPEAYPLQPGTVIPMVGARARLSHRFTVRHGILVPPFMWGGQSPNMTEQPGDVHSSGAVSPTGAMASSTPEQLGRMTVLLQLLMITDAELNYGDQHGAAGLVDYLLSKKTDLLEWTR